MLFILLLFIFQVQSQTTTANGVYGQAGSFSSNVANNGGISSTSLNSPNGIALDASGNLYISDSNNNRVLYFVTGIFTASRVYGQAGSFTSNTQNNGGVTASGLLIPKGLSLDSSGNLYVADAGNNRVLVYPSGSTTATRVYGQGGSFNQNLANNGGISSNSLNSPFCVRVDSNGNVYICDTNNNRVLFYTSTSTTATRVYGTSGSFTTPGTGSASSTTLSNPQDITFDGSGNLYISDSGFNRILIFNGASTTATSVIGQTSLTSSTAGCTISNLNSPVGLFMNFDGSLYVADGNSRVLTFRNGSAIRVYGENGSFTTCSTNNGGVSANSLYYPKSVALDSNGYVYISDTFNHRVLFYGNAGTTTGGVTTRPSICSLISYSLALIFLIYLFQTF